jgi:RHS repeat-associated protein
MQKLFIFVLVLLLTLRLSAQHEPIQPFEQELGVKVKILTLSNGKYQETFANDTLLRIGTVMYNQFTGEVVTVIENDTMYGEYNLRPEVVSRWLSPDPLASKNPTWSPYVAMNNNPILYIDPDGRDAIISIRPGANGANGTITVTLVFNAQTGSLTNAVTEKAVTSFQHTWGNGSANGVGNGTYTGSAFKDVEIDGQKYNVSYNLVLRESDNPATANEGQNTLTIIPDTETGRTSNYGGGQLEYRKGQDKGTTFGHELSHVMGIGHNDKMTDDKGTPSISSYQEGRDVITKDVVNSVQGAVQLSQGNGNSQVTLVTGRETSNMNTVNLKDSNRKTIRSAQYETIENKQ